MGGTAAALLLLSLFYPAQAAPTDLIVETTLSPILELTKELLAGIESFQHQHQHQGGEEREEGGQYAADHSHNGSGLNPTGADHDHHSTDHEHGHTHEHDHQHEHQPEHEHLQQQFHRHMEHEHQHEDGSIHAHLLPIYDSIKNEQVDVLTQIERLYSEFQSHSAEHTRKHEFPLVSLVESNPNSMTVMVSPRHFRPDIMIRLLYERVPAKRKPCVQHLDDPVVEYYPMIRDAQTYTLAELPRGKYIVCGEAMQEDSGEMIQSSCFETQISRKDDNSLQNGVKAMIVIAFVIVALVIIYAILYQVFKKTCSTQHKKEEKS